MTSSIDIDKDARLLTDMLCVPRTIQREIAFIICEIIFCRFARHECGYADVT